MGRHTWPRNGAAGMQGGGGAKNRQASWHRPRAARRRGLRGSWLRTLAGALLALAATGCDDTTPKAPTSAPATPASATSVAPARAPVDTRLARANLCLACHQVDRQLVGPSFQAIAERYASTDGALNTLARSIRDGGQGRWGALTMPKQPQVSADDARQLAQWLLALAAPPAESAEKPEPAATTNAVQTAIPATPD